MRKTCLWVLVFNLVVFCPLSSAQSTKELFQMGNQALEQGNLATAIGYYEKTIRLDPNFAPAYYQLGRAHRDIGTEQAEVAWYFKTAVELDPNFADAHNDLGKIYYAMGHFDKAERHTLRALQINPNMVSAKFSLGWIYLLGQSRPGKAIHYFEEVLARTKIPYALFGLGMAYFMNNDRVQVLEIITELRHIGENELASQLENVVRGNRYVPPQTGGRPLVNIEPISEKESKVIRSGTQLDEMGEEPRESAPQPIEGTGRIQIRGTLFNIKDIEQDTQDQPAETQPAGTTKPIGSPRHPDASDPSYSAGTLEGAQETQQPAPTTGAQRIKKLRGEVKGSGY